MGRFGEKGYYVKENAAVYFTKNMDDTVKWFEDILGWYSNIVERDEQGNGCYGAVFEMIPEVEKHIWRPLQVFICSTVNHQKR